MAEKIKVLKINPMETPRLIEIDHTLESLQEQVGGMVQAVYPWDDPVAVLTDDEGKLKGYRANRVLEDEDGNPYDILVGSFLIVGLSEDNFASLPDEMAKKYEEKFHWTEMFMKTADGQVVWMRLKPGQETPRVLF